MSEVFKTICKNNIYQISDNGVYTISGVPRSTGYKLSTKIHEHLIIGQWYELNIKGDWYMLGDGVLAGHGYVFNNFGVGQGSDLYSFFMNTEELRDYQIDKVNGRYEDRTI